MVNIEWLSSIAEDVGNMSKGTLRQVFSEIVTRLSASPSAEGDRVKIQGEIETDWLRMIETRNGLWVYFAVPKVGKKAIVLSIVDPEEDRPVTKNTLDRITYFRKKAEEELKTTEKLLVNM